MQSLKRRPCKVEIIRVARLISMVTTTRPATGHRVRVMDRRVNKFRIQTNDKNDEFSRICEQFIYLLPRGQNNIIIERSKAERYIFF